MSIKPKVERKLAAIVFTDIVGFTKLSAENEPEALQLLNTQRDLLKPIVSKFKGKWLKEIGDGLLLSFETIRDAVNCAIAIQERIISIPNLNLRIAVHEGEVVFQGNDVVGDDVNIASRIEPFAPIGGIAVSDRVNSSLVRDPEFKTKLIGTPKLKGVLRKIDVYCIISHNLPSPQRKKINAKLDSNKINWGIYSISGAILSIIGFLFWVNISFVGLGIATEIEVPSVGILLMDNLGDDDDLFWARGITEDLIIKIAGAGLIRVSPMKDIKNIDMSDEFIEIGKQLRVKYLLTSSIYKYENGFDLRCQLIEAETGLSKYANKWSEPLESSPTIVGNLATNIINALNVKTNQDLTISSVKNSDAYEYYLKAKYKWDIRETAEDIEIVRGLLLKAIELSPDLLMANNLLGETYSGWGSSEFEKALEIYNISINAPSNKENLSEIANAYQDIATIYLRKGDFDQSLIKYFEAFEIFKNQNNKLGQSSILNDISQVYERQNNIDKSLDFLNQSLEIAIELDDKLTIGKATTNIGLIYIKKGLYELALNYFKKSYEIISELKIKFGEAILMINIGNSHSRMGDYENGLKFSLDSYSMSEQLGFKYVMVYSGFAIGKMYADHGNFEDALPYLLKVKAILDETSMKDLLLENTIYLNLVQKKLNMSYEEKDIPQLLEYIYYPSFEVYFALYNLTENIDYLKTSFNSLNETAGKLDNDQKKKFLNYPIPKQIIEEYNKINA